MWRPTIRTKRFMRLVRTCCAAADAETGAKCRWKGGNMTWFDPAYCDLRIGFEVTAYVYVR